jgi:hypothetical protein
LQGKVWLFRTTTLTDLPGRHGGDRRTENFKMTAGYLENVGITPKQSSTFQQIATIPEEVADIKIKT